MLTDLPRHLSISLVITTMLLLFEVVLADRRCAVFIPSSLRVWHEIVVSGPMIVLLVFAFWALADSPAATVGVAALGGMASAALWRRPGERLRPHVACVAMAMTSVAAVIYVLASYGLSTRMESLPGEALQLSDPKPIATALTATGVVLLYVWRYERNCQRRAARS